MLRKCFFWGVFFLRIQWARSWRRAAFRFILEMCAFGPSQTRPWVHSLGNSWIWINCSTRRDSPLYFPILIFKYHYFSPSEPNKILIWHRFSFPQFSLSFMRSCSYLFEGEMWEVTFLQCTKKVIKSW